MTTLVKRSLAKANTWMISEEVITQSQIELHHADVAFINRLTNGSCNVSRIDIIRWIRTRYELPLVVAKKIVDTFYPHEHVPEMKKELILFSGEDTCS